MEGTERKVKTVMLILIWVAMVSHDFSRLSTIIFANILETKTECVLVDGAE